MTKGIIAKFTVATVLGIMTAHLWSIGEPQIAIFMIATMIFQIFFVVGEEKTKITTEEFSSLFAKEMEKWKNNKIFKN